MEKFSDIVICNETKNQTKKHVSYICFKNIVISKDFEEII